MGYLPGAFYDVKNEVQLINREWLLWLLAFPAVAGALAIAGVSYQYYSALKNPVTTIQLAYEESANLKCSMLTLQSSPTDTYLEIRRDADGSNADVFSFEDDDGPQTVTSQGFKFSFSNVYFKNQAECESTVMETGPTSLCEIFASSLPTAASQMTQIECEKANAGTSSPGPPGRKLNGPPSGDAGAGADPGGGAGTSGAADPNANADGPTPVPTLPTPTPTVVPTPAPTPCPCHCTPENLTSLFPAVQLLTVADSAASTVTMSMEGFDGVYGLTSSGVTSGFNCQEEFKTGYCSSGVFSAAAKSAFCEAYFFNKPPFQCIELRDKVRTVIVIA